METNEIIERLQQLAGKVAQSETSAEAQAQVLEGIQQLRNAITTPVEKLFRMRFAVCQNVCVRLAQELGILQALLPAEEAAPGEQVEVSAEKLSTATQTDELLVVRILRALSIGGIVDEVGPRMYAANATTRFFANAGVVGGCMYYTDLMMRVGSHLGPMARTGNVGGSGFSDPFQTTFGQPLFALLREQQEYGRAFHSFMAMRQAKARNWFDVYPIQSRARTQTDTAGRVSRRDADDPEGTVFLVDVGGGPGYWARKFRSAYPQAECPGRVIVQDLPDVVVDDGGHIISTARDGEVEVEVEVEALAYDFFGPQPIMGARFYLFKQVLHDWEDEKAVQILANTVQAMDPGISTVLVDDYVLPDEKVGLQAVCMDIGMMMANGGCERTETQWRDLLTRAGLRLVTIWRAGAGRNHGGGEAILECQLL